MFHNKWLEEQKNKTIKSNKKFTDDENNNNKEGQKEAVSKAAHGEMMVPVRLIHYEVIDIEFHTIVCSKNNFL